MLKKITKIVFSISVLSFAVTSATASETQLATLKSATPSPTPLLAPAPPSINANSYILLDAYSGKILAEKNADEQFAPASMTKVMTLYIIADALKQGQIDLSDEVLISKKAWQTGGSKMFVRVNDRVKVDDLIKGIAVVSGNDASIAMAEHIAGSEEAFSQLMNRQAQFIGMQNSHFTDSSGLDDVKQYSSARDLALLTVHFAQDFPEQYRWFKEKWYTYNDIRQPNRNRLLWRNDNVDGVKTGHTSKAGYCLIASAEEKNTRLVSVIMGSKGEDERAADSQKLLTYGFRFFETQKLYVADQSLAQPRTWKGATKTTPVGIANDVYVTIPAGQYKYLQINMELPSELKAPLQSGQVVGTITGELNGEVIFSENVVALQHNAKGGFWGNISDTVALTIHRLINGKS